jgi:hypothetical protein
MCVARPVYLRATEACRQKWTIAKAAAVGTSLALLAGAIEVSVVLGARYGFRGDIPQPFLTTLAALSALGLGLGVLRHYWDIYTHRSVRGISFLFVGLDAAGDVFSLASVGAVDVRRCSRSLPY